MRYDCRVERLVFNNCEDLWGVVREMSLNPFEVGFIVSIIQLLHQTLNSILETDGDWVKD